MKRIIALLIVAALCGCGRQESARNGEQPLTIGVSLLNVVATIDKPASHQGTDRPETKNSAVLFPARLPKKSAGTKQMSRVARTMTQSMSCRCIAELF